LVLGEGALRLLDEAPAVRAAERTSRDPVSRSTDFEDLNHA